MRYQKKTLHQQKSKKKLVLVAGLLILLAIIAYFFIARRENPSRGGNVSPAQEQIKESSDIEANKKGNLSQTPPDNQSSEKGNESHTTSPSNTLVGKIDISASQEDDGSVIVSTKLYNISSGTCSLVVSNGTKSWSKIVSVIYQPEFSTCAGFIVPTSSGLGPGSWSIVLDVVENNIKSSKTTAIEVK